MFSYLIQHEPTMQKKTIFIFSLTPGWIGISRLPFALQNEGFKVIALCPKGSYLAKTQYVDKKYVFSNRVQFRNLFLKALRKDTIDLVIPGGDLAASYFGQIMGTRFLLPFLSKKNKQLLEKSCGAPQALTTLGNKSKLQQLAAENNIQSPQNMLLDSSEQAMSESQNRTFPLVLKSDYGVAGSGVRICENAEDLQKSYREIDQGAKSKKPLNQVKNWIKRQLLLPVFIREQGVSMQNYIQGTPCMHGVYAYEGEVLSSVTVLKVACYPNETSPSSAVKTIQHPQIKKDVSRLVDLTGLSGFASFDFIVDDNNEAYILECNPRPTPIAHISHLLGGNLCAMVHKHLGGNTGKSPYPEVEHSLIALFPNELKRDKESINIKNGFHDIPFADKGLMGKFDEELRELNIDLPKSK